MSQSTIYNLKVKIISIHFKIRAINDLIQFQLFIGKSVANDRIKAFGS